MVKKSLAIVVPCYNEEAVLSETVRRLTALLERLAKAGKIAPESRVLLVDDGSHDQTWPMIEEFARGSLPVAGVKLSCNRGHQSALLAGLFCAGTDAVVSIDADLQDDVDAIETMVDRFNEGCDVVYGVRSRRDTDSVFKRTTAVAFYRLLSSMGVQTVHNHADFRLMSRRAIGALHKFQETNLYLRGIVPLLGYRSATVQYERTARFAGESKYPLRKMLGLALNAITSFSAVPLRVISVVGLLVSLGTVVVSIWALWTALGSDTAVPGWASTVLPIYFLGGVQLLSLGVIGEYVGKLYVEVKRRPRYLVERIVGSSAPFPGMPGKGALGECRGETSAGCE